MLDSTFVAADDFRRRKKDFRGYVAFIEERFWRRFLCKWLWTINNRMFVKRLRIFMHLKIRNCTRCVKYYYYIFLKLFTNYIYYILYTIIIISIFFFQLFVMLFINKILEIFDQILISIANFPRFLFQNWTKTTLDFCVNNFETIYKENSRPFGTNLTFHIPTFFRRISKTEWRNRGDWTLC